MGPINYVRGIHAVGRSWSWTARAYCLVVLSLLLTPRWLIAMCVALLPLRALSGLAYFVREVVPSAWGDTSRTVDRAFIWAVPTKFTEAEIELIRVAIGEKGGGRG